MESKPWEIKIAERIPEDPDALGITYLNDKKITIAKVPEGELREVIDRNLDIPDSRIRMEYDPAYSLGYELGHVKTYKSEEKFTPKYKEFRSPEIPKKGYKNRLKNLEEERDRIDRINDRLDFESYIISEAMALIWAYSQHKNDRRLKIEIDRLKHEAKVVNMSEDRLAELLIIASNEVGGVEK